ncbi:hypothetical protein L207DRAFT_174713 [Hyaloscypha variabilis F]|uniref:Uncharacterized protein n=1 Tax=Hyaloscypha variabilis (strain UAMH 11265 / GT02V1 / F) TaxID=1149755 RepID=A0A2J6R3F4_HYAVF|nr:hypothetical protein L207DRAFT_174713 [Hyaloscypha variabilis F]
MRPTAPIKGNLANDFKENFWLSASTQGNRRPFGSRSIGGRIVGLRTPGEGLEASNLSFSESGAETFDKCFSSAILRILIFVSYSIDTKCILWAPSYVCRLIELRSHRTMEDSCWTFSDQILLRVLPDSGVATVEVWRAVWAGHTVGQDTSCTRKCH